MSPIGVTCRRTISRALGFYSVVLAIGGFVCCLAGVFAVALEKAEGGTLSLATVWAAAVSPLLPVLAAFLAMDVWSDERRSGNIDLLLTAAVRERDYVIGKFLGVWMLLLLSLLLAFAATVGVLFFFSPSALAHGGFGGFLPALFILAVQGLLWSAFSMAVSVLFGHAATAACTSVALLVVVPRALWYGLREWSSFGRTVFAEMPFDAHAVDFASGVLSTGSLAFYVIGTVTMLFVASKGVLMLRLVGRGARLARATSVLAMFLAFLAAGLAVGLALRLDMTFDIHPGESSVGFSPRTRSILADAGGQIAVTAYMPRSDARFRSVSHFLRMLHREAKATGVTRCEVRYVDPLWDLGAAERLVRRGVVEPSIVFEKGHRIVIMPLSDGYGERVCAAAMRRLITPPQRRNVYWTRGHGEIAFDDYGAFGMSDIARDLMREGYRNETIDLSRDAPVPGDCALIVVSGAREDLSRAELGRLESYLREGGRLLVLLGSERANGLVSLLSAWGVRPERRPLAGTATHSGSDVLVSEFADHVVSAPLKGSRIVLENPIAFIPSSVAGTGVDHLEFTPLASVASVAVVASVERGVGAGSDLAIRPTRIVAVGDAGFALNGSLPVRANANRDFFLNCVAYLAGIDSSGSSGVNADLLVVGLDRRALLAFVLFSAGLLPGSFVLLMFVRVFARRRRR